MNVPRIRISVAMLLLVVAASALLLAAFLYGRREGKREVLAAPESAALSLVRSLPIESDEEGCAVFFLAKRHEEEEPGFLSGYTRVTTRNLKENHDAESEGEPRDRGDHQWAVIFYSPTADQAHEDHWTFDDGLVDEYRRMRGKLRVPASEPVR